MKKISLSLLLTISINFITNSQIQDLVWSKNLSGKFGVENQIKNDNQGNIYILGSFTGSVDFDPSLNDYFLSTTGLIYQNFISKYDKNGNFIWAKVYEGNGQISYNSIIFDNSNNLYIAGSYSGILDFDLGLGNHILQSVYIPNTQNTHYFVSKINSESSDLIWINEVQKGNAYDLVLDTDGNVYATGNSNYFIYVAKYDNNGNTIWINHLVNPVSQFDGSGRGMSIAIDNSNNVVVCGGFYFWVDFDTSSAINNISSESGGTFIVKYNSAGQFISVKNQLPFFSNKPSDTNGNIYISGDIYNYIDLNPDPNVVFNVQYEPVIGEQSHKYIAKYNSNGELLWAKDSGSFNKMRIDKQTGEIYLIGFKNNETYDMFLKKIDNEGNLVWTKQFDTVDKNELAEDLSISSLKDIYLTGIERPLNSNNSNLLIQKYSYLATPLPINLIAFEGIANEKSNLLTWKTAKFDELDYFEIEKSTESNNGYKIGKVTEPKAIDSISYYEFNDTNPIENQYYRLKMFDKNGIKSYSKIIFVKSEGNLELSIGPNPSNGKMFLKASNEIQNIEIYSSDGQKVYSSIVNSNIFEINLKNYIKGNYIIKACINTQIITKKIVMD